MDTLDPTLEIRDGSRAVRVTALLDDTVLQVRLLPPSLPLGVTPVTRGLVLIGACTVLGGVAALALGQPGLGAGLLILAVVALVPGGMRWRQERVPHSFVLGEGRLPLDGRPLTLVQTTPAGHLVLITDSMQGQIHLPDGGEAAALSCAGTYPIPRDARIELSVGPYTIQIVSELPPRRLRRRSLFAFVRRDDRLCHTSSLVLHASVLLLALAIPPGALTLSHDHMDRLELRRRQRPVPVAYGSWSPVDSWVPGGSDGQRALGPQGRMGDPQARQSARRYQLRGPRDNVDPHLARQAALEQARSAGILSLLGSRNEVFARLFGAGSVLGTDMANVLGSLEGNTLGDAYGIGGLGLVGTGRGGGGRGEFIGLGSLGTIGRGSGVGRGDGYGRGVGRLGRCSDGTGRCGAYVGVIAGRAEVTGSLDKEVIRRVIRRHINEWKYCYQKELQANPNLGGRLALRFTIGPDGRVLASTLGESNVGNAEVESCMVQAVRRWQFPRPRGGGIVVVNYPVRVRLAGG